jgi:lauroyl/myristoyl acyltransferase
MHFRVAKDAIAMPLHRFGYFVAGLPTGLGRAAMGCLGAMARTAYFVPESHLRKTTTHFCRVTGQAEPGRSFSRRVDNVENAALHFAHFYRYGRAELVAQTTLDPNLEIEYRRLSKGGQGVIIVVPHCAGAVLSSAALSDFCPTVLLVREPKDGGRRQLMLEYLRKLGPEFILTRNVPPATVMRSVVRALRDGKAVVGTTDLVNGGADSFETRVLGRQVLSPAWPARLSARLEAPILPGYIHMNGSQITLTADKGYLEQDLQQSTQRWMSSFERHFRQYPSDWVFMLDKNWSRLLATAAAGVAQPQKSAFLKQQAQ